MIRRKKKSGFSLVELLEGLVAVGLLGGVVLLAILLPAMNIARQGEPPVDEQTQAAAMVPENGPLRTAGRSLRSTNEPLVPVDQALADLEHLNSRFDIAYRAVYARPMVTDADVAELVRIVRLGPAEPGRTAIEKSELVLWDWLREIEVVSLVNSKITDASIAYLNEISTIQELDLSSTQISDVGVVQLKGADLRLLALSATNIGDSSVAVVSQFRGLRQLYLSDTRISDAGMSHLAASNRLQVLELNGNGLSDASLAVIGKIKSLRELFLRGQPITDAGTPHFIGLSQLEVLDLGETNLGDASAAHLKRMYMLSELDVTDSRFTQRGLKELAAALQDCEISNSLIDD